MADGRHLYEQGTPVDRILADTERCIHELFQAQAERTPGAAALVAEDRCLTYAELDEAANRLAHHLRGRGVGPESRVAVCLERSGELVVALLAVLKAGGGYVPLDPAYPRERIAHMLADSGAALLVTRAALLPLLPETAAGVLCLDEADLAAEPATAPESGVGAGNLAYVIYTSGSTGTPKGVLIEHRALANHMRWMQDAFPLDAGDAVLQKTPFSFDAAVWEFYAPLMAGARLVVARPGEEREPARLVHTIREQRVTVVQVVPTLLRMLVDEPELAACHTLRRVFSGGEALPAELACRCPVPVVNLYGPTESCIDATFHAATGTEATHTVPIGRAVANVRAYVLDADLRPAAEGELFIGGAQVARGYLGRPALTAERFIPDPAGGRMYRTGDRVRTLPDGTLEFLGRTDGQVKLRGFRVELGEVEAALRKHAREAVAMVREDAPGDQRLVAYVVGGPDEAELRAALKGGLPEYMVPTAFVALDALPLTPNGKVDRAALPAPERGEEGYVAPRTPTEEVLSGIWAAVMGVERVGIDDDFFALGGHSLLAMQIVARTRDALRAEVPVSAFFDTPTVAEMAAAIERGAGAESPFVAVEPAPRDRPLPLSFPQEQIWFLHHLHEDSLAYSYQSVFTLRGTLDVDALQRTLTEIIRRHEIFRTSFPEQGGRGVQRVHPPFVPDLPIADLSALPAGEREARRDEIIRARGCETFDMTRLPLVRWELVRMAADEHVLVHVEHHLVHDGWSFNTFVREFLTLYRAFAAGEPSPLPELTIQFGDFAHWQREWMESEAAARQVEFWTRTLAGAPPVLDLPYDHPRAPRQRFRGNALRFEIPAALADRLREFSRAEGTTLYMTMRSAFLVLLSRYTGQTDLCVGSGMANRRLQAFEQLIGMTVKMVVPRTDLSDDPTFRELLRRVRAILLQAHAHQDCSFDRVVGALQPERSLSHNPLFQIAFSFHDAPMPFVETPGLDVTLKEGLNNGTSKFDLDVVAIPRAHGDDNYSYGWEPGGITLFWTYDRDLFDEAPMARMADRFLALLEEVTHAPERRVSELPLMGADERDRLLAEWSGTEAAYPEQCVHEVIAAQAARTPHAAAVVSEDRTLTYAELEASANRLAHHLRAHGVGPESRVALCLERGADLVVALLGVLKAGGAYVPLDPAYPAERLERLAKDCGAGLVVARGIDIPGTATVCLDRVRDAIAREPATAPESGVRPGNLAYVIFTSGSTGTPKGVAVEHRQLANYTRAVTERLRLEGAASFALVSTLVADLGNTMLFPALCGGKTLHVPSRDTAFTLHAFTEYSQRHGIDALKIVPAHLDSLVGTGERGLPRTHLVLGGEAADPRWVDRLGRMAPGLTISNHYGPTETTVGVLTHRVELTDSLPAKVPLGRPLPNVRVYVLDASLTPVPLGVPGELFVGGAQVARGYLGRPALTAERFIPDPFQRGRMYRTGDRVRWLADGTLEFLGRTDGQVKLRGFRIELGEIEAALRAHVQDAVAMVREDAPGDRRLVAYVVAPPAGADLRALLRATLPDYMVPSAFVTLDALPLTPNGKVDRRALPVPERTAAGEAYVAPRTPDEEVLCGIWAEVLGVERVGIDDDFFALGGHSLLAMQIVARTRDALHADVPVSAFFGSPTVAGITAALRPLKTDLIAIPTRAEPGLADLSADELARMLDELSAGDAV